MLLEKADEMECAVAGCNFLLRAILHEAFTFEANQAHFVASNGAPTFRWPQDWKPVVLQI